MSKYLPVIWTAWWCNVINIFIKMSQTFYQIGHLCSGFIDDFAGQLKAYNFCFPQLMHNKNAILLQIRAHSWEPCWLVCVAIVDWVHCACDYVGSETVKYYHETYFHYCQKYQRISNEKLLCACELICFHSDRICTSVSLFSHFERLEWRFGPLFTFQNIFIILGLQLGDQHNQSCYLCNLNNMLNV